MKQIIYSTLCVTMLASSATASTKDARPAERFSPGTAMKLQVNATDNVEKFVDECGVTTIIPRSMAPRYQEGESPEGMVKIVCHMIYNPENWHPDDYVCAYNTDTHFNGYWDGESESVIVYTEPGTYDVIMNFSRIAPESMYGRAEDRIVIMEDVDASSDVTIDFDPTTATRHIAVEPFYASGEKVEVATYKYIDSNWTAQEVKEGNCWGYYYEKVLSKEGVGPIQSRGGTIGVNWEASDIAGDLDINWFTDWYINDVSDKYRMTSTMIMDTPNPEAPLEMCVMSTDGVTAATMSNDPSRYFKRILSAYIQHSPLAVDAPGQSYYPYGLCFSYMPWFSSINVYSDNKDKFYNLRFCPDNNPDNDVKFSIRFGLVDYVDLETVDLGDFSFENEVEYYTQTAWYEPQEGDYFAAVRNDDATLQRDADGEYVYTTNDFLSFDYSDCRIEAGASAPFCQWHVLDAGYEGEAKHVNVFYQYFGLIGDCRDTDQLFAEHGESGTERKFELTITDTNFALDGIAGCSVMSAQINLDTDVAIPVLTGLQLRTPDGVVTDRFENATDARMLFTAGSFTNIDLGYGEFGSPLWASEYAAPTVKVEYAPNGSDTFTQLEAVSSWTPILPGIGDLYTVDLSAIDRESNNDWYDARITITTDGGNVQTQTIAPLFRIGKLTEISQASADEADGTGEYYNLQGMRISPTNLAPGLYISRQSGKTRKVILP